MLKSTTSGWFSRMASRSSRSLRNHGLASSAVSPIGAIVTGDSLSDLGVVGDLHEIVPAVNAEIRKRKG